MRKFAILAFVALGLTQLSTSVGAGFVRFMPGIGDVPLSVAPGKGKRVAVVVGNENYAHLNRSELSANDAKAVAKIFTTAGFDSVVSSINADSKAFKAAIDEIKAARTRLDGLYSSDQAAFRKAVEAGEFIELLVFYFAGLGTNVAGKDVLVFTDAESVNSESQLGIEGVDTLISELAEFAAKKVFILDTCTEQKSFLPAGDTETLVIVSASDGCPQIEPNAAHSVFVESLVQHISEPGEQLIAAFGRIYVDVQKRTVGLQRPRIFGWVDLAPLVPRVAPVEIKKRVALVIGNGNYDYAPPLINPKNDAKKIAEALTRLGFEVRTELDLGILRFGQVMAEFAATADGADVAIVYYSGHAIELQGVGYLMPVDARPLTRAHIRNQLKPLRNIVSDLENTSGLKLVIVDGCRNNPFAEKLAGILGVPKAALGRPRGFAADEIEERQAGDLLAVFATLPGEVAYDGGEQNSPFTTALLKYVESVNVDIGKIFGMVYDDVKATTKGMQLPDITVRRGRRDYVLRTSG